MEERLANLTNKEQVVIHLRRFFDISNAAFDMQNVVKSAFGINIVPTYMESLHRMALNEIKKDNPDLSKIDFLLSEMEIAADVDKNKE